MTALDRAIIKAFHRPSPRSGTAVAEPPAAAPSGGVVAQRVGLQVAVGPAVPLSRALAELAATPDDLPSPACRARQDRRGARGDDLPSPSGRGAGDEGFSSSSSDEHSVGTRIEAGSEGCLQPRAVKRDPIGPIAHYPDPLRARTEGLTPAKDRETAAAPVGASIAALLDQAAFQETTSQEAASQEPGETRWRPLLQVDRVVWPSIHVRLQSTAPAAIEQMTEGLLSLCASGAKALGLASCGSGEGVTTLLSAAARKLQSQGRKVVLVDANWNNPQLAQSLGLMPQIGWEETLRGSLPLEEVVIESLADGLSVLPVRGPSASAIAEGQIAASFEILTREFDVVLVDLGSLAQVEDEDTPSRGVAARMDAVVLVQNVRVTPPNRMAQARQRLAALNLRCAGTIQNFVAG